MPRPRIALLLIAALLTGCASTVVRRDSDRYYTEGADEALAALSRSPAPPEDRLLALMDEAVAEQELGRYEDSNRTLAAALELARSQPGAGPGQVADRDGAYRCESFERVFLWTLKTANDLALQDVAAAAADAEGALTAISSGGCPRCRFPFTRYLAAVSLEAVGEVDRAVDVLAEAFSESPGLSFLETELDRMLAEAESAPGDRATAGERVLYVLFFLGKGPQKVPDVLPVPPSRVVPWPRYASREPPGVAGATLLVGRQAQVAVALTDMEELARSSLAERLEADITRQVGESAAAEALSGAAGGYATFNLGQMFAVLPALNHCDLRHWSTLPATCQVARVVVGPEASGFEIIYTTADGTIVDREDLDLPASWTAGPLFVTRRLP